MLPILFCDAAPDAWGARFDLVVANILAEPLIALAPRLAGALADEIHGDDGRSGDGLLEGTDDIAQALFEQGAGDADAGMAGAQNARGFLGVGEVVGAAADAASVRFATVETGTYTVRGKAWSGTGPVTRVDVSLTGEGEWHPAKLEPPKGPYQWQDWSFEWEATDIGRQTLRARATDAAGNVQPEIPPWNRLGYGNNAIEVSSVDVR